jgi:hypothetical protein
MASLTKEGSPNLIHLVYDCLGEDVHRHVIYRSAIQTGSDEGRAANNRQRGPFLDVKPFRIFIQEGQPIRHM